MEALDARLIESHTSIQVAMQKVVVQEAVAKAFVSVERVDRARVISKAEGVWKANGSMDVVNLQGYHDPAQRADGKCHNSDGCINGAHPY